MKTSRSYKRTILTKIIGAGIFILASMNLQVSYCQFWPVSFDGAPALKPAQLEISLYGAGSYISSDGGGGTIGYIPGMRVGIGIVKNFDVKLSYSRGFYKFDKLADSKQNNIGIMPKVSFLKGHLAFQFPFTVILFNIKRYEESKLETYYLLNPRFIISFHYKQYVEFNMTPSFEAFIPGHDIDPSYFIGGNIGFAFSSNLQRWSVRPEGFISYLFPKGENNNIIYYGWGLAFTFNIDLIKPKPETKPQ
jgi:hypothetical protein